MFCPIIKKECRRGSCNFFDLKREKADFNGCLFAQLTWLLCEYFIKQLKGKSPGEKGDI